MDEVQQSVTEFGFKKACKKCGELCCYEENIYGSSEELVTLGVKKITRQPNGACMFLKNGVCSVYSQRPLECRIFPFDIELTGNKFMWILWEICPVHTLLSIDKSIPYFENELLTQYPEEYLYKYVDHHKTTSPGSKYENCTYRVLKQVHRDGVPFFYNAP